MVLGASVLEDTSMHDVLVMLMNVSLIHANMEEVAKTVWTNSYVTACQDMAENSVKSILTNAHQIPVNMEVFVGIISLHMYVNVYLATLALIVNRISMTVPLTDVKTEGLV